LRILKVKKELIITGSRGGFTTLDPLEDTESCGGGYQFQWSVPGFTTLDPLEDTERGQSGAGELSAGEFHHARSA